jgi:hypothetical protein
LTILMEWRFRDNIPRATEFTKVETLGRWEW